MRILAIVLLVLAGCGCVSLPTASHSAALRLQFADHGLCSATAVGPSTLLTATHCLDSALATVSGRAATVISRTDDGHDHSLLRVDIGFDHWAQFGAAPTQGQGVSYYGNALGLNALLRKGYVAGYENDTYLLDIEGAPGDSGAGVLDDSGRVIGVVSQIMRGKHDEFRMMLVFPLVFSTKQLENAAS